MPLSCMAVFPFASTSMALRRSLIHYAKIRDSRNWSLALRKDRVGHGCLPRFKTANCRGCVSSKFWGRRGSGSI